MEESLKTYAKDTLMGAIELYMLACGWRHPDMDAQLKDFMETIEKITDVDTPGDSSTEP